MATFNWAEVEAFGAVGTVTGVLSAIVSRLLARRDRAVIDHAMLGENMKKLPALESTLNKHLVECSEAHGRVNATLSSLDANILRLNQALNDLKRRG